MNEPGIGGKSEPPVGLLNVEVVGDEGELPVLVEGPEKPPLGRGKEPEGGINEGPLTSPN